MWKLSGKFHFFLRFCTRERSKTYALDENFFWIIKCLEKTISSPIIWWDIISFQADPTYGETFRYQCLLEFLYYLENCHFIKNETVRKMQLKFLIKCPRLKTFQRYIVPSSESIICSFSVRNTSVISVVTLSIDVYPQMIFTKMYLVHGSQRNGHIFLFILFKHGLKQLFLYF